MTLVQKKIHGVFRENWGLESNYPDCGEPFEHSKLARSIFITMIIIKLIIMIMLIIKIIMIIIIIQTVVNLLSTANWLGVFLSS